VLSPLQEQILDLLSRGMGDKQIAARMDISRHNVDYHLRALPVDAAGTGPPVRATSLATTLATA